VLTKLFSNLTIDLHDIDTHANEECIILHDKYVDDPDDNTNRKIEYKDTELSPDNLALVNTIRGQLKAYNKLLKHTFIDVPSYTSSTFPRTIKYGKYAGRKQIISLGQTTSLSHVYSMKVWLRSGNVGEGSIVVGGNK
jgi:hypothetical protein